MCKVKKSFKNLNFLTLGIFLAKYKEWNLIRIFFADTLEAWQLISIFAGGSPPPPSLLANKPKILVEAGVRRLNVLFAVAARRTMAQIGQKVAKIIKIVVFRGYEELVSRYELNTI